MAKKNANADDLIAVIIKGIEEVKGGNIQLLDLRELENTVCDYFIISLVSLRVLLGSSAAIGLHARKDL